MEKRIVSEDVSEVAAGLLAADKCRLAEEQAQLKADFEAHEAKFNADLAAVGPQKAKGPAQPNPGGSWFLARKCWAWMRRDD